MMTSQDVKNREISPMVFYDFYALGSLKGWFKKNKLKSLVIICQKTAENIGLLLSDKTGKRYKNTSKIV